MGATEQLARFIAETPYESIDNKAIEVAKGIIMSEGLGPTLAGAVEPQGEIAARFVKDLGGKRQAVVAAKGFRTTAPQAAWANATMSHIADYDGSLGFAHVGFLSAALLALGEALGSSGKDLLAAYVLGAETGARINTVVGGVAGAHYTRGWHPTSTIGTLMACAGCARLMKLNAEQTRVALGFGVSQISGVRQNFGTMTKPFHAGNAARNGVMAAMLAKRGITADLNILEERFGFYNVFCEKGFNLAPVTKDLGAKYDIVDGAVIKQYPCCLVTHTSLDAVLDMIKKNDITPQQVETIECAVYPESPKILVYNSPNTAMQGKFSMQYCVAIAMLEKKAGMAQFTDEKVNSAAAQAMMKKVSMVVDPGMKVENGATVTIKLKDGRKFSQREEIPRGSPGKPLARADLIAKFEDCAQLAISKRDVKRTIKVVEDLDAVENVSELAECILNPK